MTEREKMVAGLPYDPTDPQLTADRARVTALTMRINVEPDLVARRVLVNELVEAADGAASIVPGFFCEYGYNVKLGRRAFVNSGGAFLDCAPIVIGDDFQCGPGVQLLTPMHPLDAVKRRSGVEWARSIHIGNDVWIGGGAIVLGGVTIGDRVVIGAGSVVTRDVPDDVLVVGNPARVVRSLLSSETNDGISSGS